uniref:Uncharacterized protein n=1 Tax=Ditylenchus dipsaci TaxID=166011 RepID=A0A915E788_9BILA
MAGTGGGSQQPELDPSKAAVKESILNTFRNKATFTGVPGGVSTGIYEETIFKPAVSREAEDDNEVLEIMSKLSTREKSLEEMQKKVLQLELENQQKIPPILDKVNNLIDRVSAADSSSSNDEEPNDPLPARKRKI